jgi:hypothetical protein
MNEPLGPSVEQIHNLRALDRGQPVLMLNLLEFRESASYPAEMSEPERSGYEAYMIYGTATSGLIGSVGGHIVNQAHGGSSFIGTHADNWDMLALVSYPTIAGFLKMLAMPEYRRWLPHRTAGLKRTRLICFNGQAPDRGPNAGHGS